MARILTERQRRGRRQRNQGCGEGEQKEGEGKLGLLRQRYAIEEIATSILSGYSHGSPSVHLG